MGGGFGTGGAAGVGRTPASNNSLALFTDPLLSDFGSDELGPGPPFAKGLELIDTWPS